MLLLKVRHPFSFSCSEKFLLGFGLLSSVVALGFTVQRLTKLPRWSDDFTFTLMTLIPILFNAWFIISGIVKARFQDIIAFILSFAIMTFYLGISVFSSHETDPDPLLKKVRFGLAVASFVVVLLFGGYSAWDYYVRREYIYRINAKGEMQSKLCRLFWCSSFISFDLEVQVSMIILVMDEGMMWNEVDIIVIVGGLLILIAWAVAGFKAIYLESDKYFWIFMFLLWPNAVYNVWRIVSVSMIILVMDEGMMWNEVDIIVIVGGLLILIAWAVAGFKAIYLESDKYFWIFMFLLWPNAVYNVWRIVSIYRERPMEAWNILRHAVLGCGVIALLTRLTVGISMCVFKRDFGKGVKEKLAQFREPREDEAAPLTTIQDNV
ncbi:uncharacterized protein ISCGN_007307 [Ixodes scapularis]